MKRFLNSATLGLCGICAIFGLASPARGANITIFSTGVDAEGDLLPGGSVDPHYVWSYGAGTVGNFGDPYNPATSTFFSAPNFPTAFTPEDGYVTPDSGPLVGNGPFWNAENPDAKSISFNNVGGGGGDVPFTYQTTFNLTGLYPATASISLNWFVDDWGVIAINGVVQPGTGGGTYTLNSGFVSGVNTLDFVTYNGGGPGGISVQILGATADDAAAPEPGTLDLVVLGLASIVLAGLALQRRPCCSKVSNS
jgi:hypothetical protein